MGEAKKNTEGSIEQADDKDIKITTAADIIIDVVKNEVIVDQNVGNRPRGG